jgi:hypothetical protein
VPYNPGSHAGPFAVGMFGDAGREFAGLVAGGRVREIGASTSSLLRDWDAAVERLGELAAEEHGGGWRCAA